MQENQFNWVKDVQKMHQKFGVNEKVNQFEIERLKTFLEFRVKFLQEEL